ncbi:MULTISPECIES: MFS transporter [unclassified Sphingobium]|uniref:MFS transporter n=1 Tax=unclassified Sphingobium TaxID=2611147 RepID=UPI002224791E|nr:MULTISPECIES: MFS transporter [unclassified Sphingobium]MCW2349191.1 MFS family permease [Sphingobium sp. B12D2B]MCW2368284.1 MFS family permease [Sphingobium sp. B11D3D]MCW2382999.1 MFS family permease [Sphingobium sp. B2D3B]MCW2400025.1 MFS family permease [Sphingobium sp. B2D3C]
MDARPGLAGGALKPAATKFSSHQLWALTILGIFSGFNMVDRGLLALNLEPIKLELGATDTQMSLAAGIGFFLLNAVAGVPLARLADRYSRRDIIAIGFGFYSLIIGLMGMVTSFVGLLFTRMLLGIGEASGNAPSSAMVNDLVPPQNRRMALASLRIFGAIIVLVMMSSLGYVTDRYGWRASFYVLALPAIILVPLAIFTVREPEREKDAQGKAIAPVSLKAAWAQWRRSPAFLLVITGFALAGVTLQANSVWAPAFLVRVRELSPTEIGVLSGISRGPALLIGALVGAWVTDRLARRDHRWRFWVPGIMLMLGAPAEMTYLMADDYWVWMPAYLLTGMLIMGSQASTVAICMDVSGAGLRATGLAFALLASNFLADLIGPTSIGLMNDTIFADLGVHALRYSMGIVACSAAVGGFLIFVASRFETEQTRSG